MANVQVILTADVENLGHVGDVVSVRAGYGRNHLIPEGKAVLATKANLAMMSARRKVFEAAAARARSDAEGLAARLAGLTCSVARKVGESEALYGSVTSADVAECLSAQGIVVDKRRILLPEPIKTLGEHAVTVRLHADVAARVKVVVTAAE